MKVIVTIAVPNPEWYWSDEAMKEAGDYREEWEALNESKIYKHVPSETFEIGFDVKNINDNREGTYKLGIVSEDQNQTIGHTLKDVTVIDFIGNEKQASLVISNSLIHQYIAARQRQHKHYLYCYLKEDTSYTRQNALVWLSDEHQKELEQTLNNRT